MGFLRVIHAYKLREGLCHMIWKSHLQSRVIAMARIMEQSGPLSDSHLERHVQVGRCALGEFFNFCSNILDIIIEVSLLGLAGHLYIHLLLLFYLYIMIK